MHKSYPSNISYYYAQNGFAPLHSASQEGNMKIVELLAENGANIDIKEKV